MRPAESAVPRSPWRIALIPGLITLAVSVVRLLGELQLGPPILFNRNPGGDGALIGVTWLVPIAGLWFAWKARNAGFVPVSPARGVLWPLFGTLAMAACAALVIGVIKLSLPVALLVIAPLALACTLFVRAAWPALFRSLAVYGLYARVPVIGITALAAFRGWDTHYQKVGPDDLPLSPGMQTLWIGVAQIGIWIPLTVLIGGLIGGLFGGFIGLRKDSTRNGNRAPSC